jgi:hypothetical protein
MTALQKRQKRLRIKNTYLRFKYKNRESDRKYKRELLEKERLESEENKRLFLNLLGTN